MKLLFMPSRSQSGFGLVELMIAMTLGLILLGSLGYVFLGTRGAYRVTDNLSRMQENARYALDVMSRDIRMAGYSGCVNLASSRVATIAAPPVPVMGVGNSLIGYDNGTGWTNPTTIARPSGMPGGGDVISIMAAYGGEAYLTGNLTPTNAQVQVNANTLGFKQNDVLIVTDCSAADIFRVTNSPGTSGSITLTHATGSNCPRDPSTGLCKSGPANRVNSYGTDAFVMRMDQFSYFVGEKTVITAPGTLGQKIPGLYRTGLYNTEELVENVVQIQFSYGLDTNSDGAVDSYSPNPGNWAQVVSVKIELLMRSPDDNVSTAMQAVTFNNGTFNAPDRRLYQVFSATVGVRNRLPAQ